LRIADNPSGEVGLYMDYDKHLAIAEAHLGSGGQQNLLLRPYIVDEPFSEP
jgi:hypothetical protein